MKRPPILIVDDDPTVLGAVSAVLSLEGYEVRSASDGGEALRSALSEPPVLVVLDVTMPGINGWEICDILRRQSHTRDVPVLFLTGRVEVHDQITAMQVGGSDYLRKPFRADDLRAKVRALTGRAPRKKGN